MNQKRPTPTVLFRALLLSVLVLTLVPHRAQAGDDPKAAIWSLDLSLPREMSTGTRVQPSGGDAIRQPDLRGRSNRPGGASIPPRDGGRLRGDLPYGAGYEARQGGNGRGSGRRMGFEHGRGR